MDHEQRVEFGDFQTPVELALAVCRTIKKLGIFPRIVVEPTCGLGSFVEGALGEFGGLSHLRAYDINKDHVQATRNVIHKLETESSFVIERRDFFSTDWDSEFRLLDSDVLVLGNPPWVTSAALSTIGSENLPPKRNFQNRTGLDAKTGKANFDVSEWMLIRLIESLAKTSSGYLAMLCKFAVARKVLHHCWTLGLPIKHAEIRLIDAKKHFGVSVAACLFYVHIKPGFGIPKPICPVYKDLETSESTQVIGKKNGELVADIRIYDQFRDLEGRSPLRWRSGMKHDAARIMELSKTDSGVVNGFGDVVDIEPTYMYPLLKSSDVANSRKMVTRFVIVPQRNVSDDTREIADIAPRTWSYLQSHAASLDGRGSAVYRNRPRFAVFGVGEYTFTPWKVAVSGLYKNLQFLAVGPVRDRPVILDDTCYLVPCQSEKHAILLEGMLNDKTAQAFLRALVFPDAKRLVNADILNRIALNRLAERLGVSNQFGEMINKSDLPDSRFSV